MIPKIFLVAFLSLQGSNRQSPKEDAALEGTARFDVLNQPTTTTFRAATIGGIEDLSSPKVQTTGDDYQIPIQISPGQDAVIQRGSKEINVCPPLTLSPSRPPPPPLPSFLHPAIKLSCTNEKKYIRTYVNSLRLDSKKKFNNVPPGFYDPSKVSFPDGFEILGQPHTWNLADAFPLIAPPPGISRVWGPFPAGGHFDFIFNGARGAATNVSIEFGWIENGALTAGSYTSEIWTLGFRGWRIVQGPSGSFNGSGWETTTNIVASGDRFVFDFSGGPSDKVLAVSRVFYDLP